MDTKRNAVFKFLDEVAEEEPCCDSAQIDYYDRPQSASLKRINIVFVVIVLLSYVFLVIHMSPIMPSETFNFIFYPFSCGSVILVLVGFAVKSHKTSNLLISISIFLVGLCLFSFALYFKGKARKEDKIVEDSIKNMTELQTNFENLVEISVADVFANSSRLSESSDLLIKCMRRYVQASFGATLFWILSYLYLEKFDCLTGFTCLTTGVTLTWVLVSNSRILMQISFPCQFILMFCSIYALKYNLNSAITSLNQKNAKLSKIQDFNYQWLLNLNVSYFILKDEKLFFCNKHYENTVKESRESGKMEVNTPLVPGLKKGDKCKEVCEAIMANDYCKFTKIAVATDGSSFFECLAKKYSSGYVEVFFLDITHSVTKEKQKVNEKYRNTVFAKVAHEFKTPITNIAYLADKIKGETRDSSIAKELNMMKGLSDYVTFLVSDITSYCNPSAKMTILPESINLKTVLEFSHNVLCSLLEVKSSVKRKVTPILRNNCDLMLMIDQIRLKQILLNILSNAAKFTTHGKITLSSEDKGTHVLLTVKDEGIGIPANKLAQLKSNDEIKFEVRDEYNKMGSGLGVSISKQMCKEMGFFFNIDSVEGKGTTVTVSIPKDEADNESTFSEKTELFEGPYLLQSSLELDTSLVLVVEDNSLIRRAMKTMLEAIAAEYSKNWTVLEVEDGIFALNEVINFNLEGQKVEFLLTDEFMDFLSGSATVSILKKLMNDQKIAKFPCISCSAFEDENFKEKITNCGADQLLSKPVSKDNLALALREEGLI